MIWKFLVWIYFFWKAFWRIPHPDEFVFINPNKKCGCCGATRGYLRTVVTLNPKILAEDEVRPKELRVRRTCAVCGASTHFAPLSREVSMKNTLPSVARNDMEKAEDLRITLQQSA